ncbi:MAG: DNA polymerase III subunit beta [Chthonomonadales bacterium]|nr:DNA polymerase III subunit beta [Chthonomonadales bacterium]
MDTSPTAAEPTLKATCARKDLFDGVQTVAHAVSGRSALPILSHVLVQAEEGGLRLSATDLQLSIALSIPATVEEPGALTATARVLTELLGTLPESEVAISVDRSHAVRLHCDRSDYKLLGLPPEEYPRLPEVQEANSFRLPQARLRSMIRDTVFAVSTDEARPILTGVLMDFADNSVRFVATDTHRLAMRQAPVQNGQGAQAAIVPARAMNELQRLLTGDEGDVHVRLSGNQVMFATPGGAGVVSRLIEGQFPNYQRVIPSAHRTRLTLETQPMLRAVRRASIVARGSLDRVVLRTLDDRLTITAESSAEGNAYEEVEVAREGDDVQIAFNAKYLLDVLGVLDEEGFRLDVTEPLKPGIVRPVPSEEVAGDEYLCVLMPMQIV